ncbi:hypothetical protein TNCV_4811451 [Trichonephila clavipes]|nr:hypothetical protein TNCV_4811451 [Trichonephila clavipes]
MTLNVSGGSEETTYPPLLFDIGIGALHLCDVLTDDVISRVFIESSALEQVVAIHSVMAAEWAKVGNSIGSLQMPRDWAHSGHSFSWFSKTLRFLGHGSIFVNICRDNVLYSSEGQGDFRLSRLGSLLGILVGSFIAGDPKMTWNPL